MLRLGVNIDHVATVRQARRAKSPDPVHAAVLAEMGGADGITVHLRGDRRHIHDRDVQVLRQTVSTRLNIEMATTQEMTHLALAAKPDQVTLVPERREELTTEGGLDVVLNAVQVRPMVHRSRARAGQGGAQARRARRRAQHGRLLGVRQPPGARGGGPEAARRRAARPQAGARGPRRPRPRLPERGRDRGDERDRRAQHRPLDRGTGGTRRDGARGAGNGGNHAGWTGVPGLTAFRKPPMLSPLP
jgi:hypothetical protein